MIKMKIPLLCFHFLIAGLSPLNLAKSFQYDVAGVHIVKTNSKASLGKISEIHIENEDALLTTPEIIAKYGYPVELHNITTSDGYILTMHRIPYGKKSGPAKNKPVIWIQHGLFGDSSNWVMNEENKALAYVFANLGYDVWLGNARGSRYSKAHVSLSTDDPAFWKFSWHEMGVYDVPAVLQYILNETSQPDLYYLGHSMGTTMCFVAMSTYPDLNSKIRLMTDLAPVAFVQHMRSPLVLLAPYVNQLEWLLEYMGVNEFLPTSELMQFLGSKLCQSSSPVQEVCSNALFLMAGYNVDQLNTTMLPAIFGHMPGSTSTRTVVHFAQEINSGLFRQYDYGSRENMVVYGTGNPPEYNISKITTPVALYWGENDWMGGPVDVYRLAEQLPNLVKKYRVRHDFYNHLDFLWAMDNHVLLNNEIIDFIKHF